MDGNKFNSSDLLQAFTAAVANSAAGKPSIRLDAAKYLEFLVEMDAPEEQKLELLAVIESIIVAFVDLGFGVHPVQQACGQVTKELDQGGQTDSHEISPKDTGPAEGFNNTAPKQE